MKVFINKLPRDYSAGMIIVAASNKEEADRVYYDWLVKKGDLDLWSCDYSRILTYQEFCKSEDRDSRYYYQQSGWVELTGLTADSFLAPQVLEEENYIE